MRLAKQIGLTLATFTLIAGCGPTRGVQPGSRPSPSDSPIIGTAASTSGAGQASATGQASAPGQDSAPGQGIALGSGGAPGQDGCVGAIPADTQASPTLTPADTVTAGVVCQESTQRVPGDGDWKVLSVAHLTASQLAALVDALRRPDSTPPSGGVCTFIGYLIAPWSLTLADGRHVQPRIPTDGCAPSQAVRQLLSAASKNDNVTVTRIAHTRGEAEVASGCSDGLKDIVWREKQRLDVTMPTAPTADETVAVCLSTRDSKDTMLDAKGAILSYVLRLSATGQSTGAAVSQLLASLKPGPWPAECDGKATSSMVGIQSMQRTSAQPKTILYAEIGGCHRVMTGELQPAGTADAAAIANVAALATQPVERP